MAWHGDPIHGACLAARPVVHAAAGNARDGKGTVVVYCGWPAAQ